MLGAYLICSESLLDQNVLNPLNMISLQLNQALFNRPAAGQLGFKVSAELLKVDLMWIYALDHCHLFSVSALLHFDCYPLLLLGNLLADAQLLGKAAYGTHLRTHLVAVTSATYLQ